MKYAAYELSLEFKEKDDKLSVKEQEDYWFKALDIYEAVNQFPFAQIDIDAEKAATFRNVRNISIKFTTEETNTSFNVVMGVTTILLNGDKVHFSGWLVPWEDIRVTHTRYLGDSALDVLTDMKLRDTVNLKKENDKQGSLYQINASNMQQYLALCDTVATTPFWSISKTATNLEEVIIENKNLDDKHSMQQNGAITLQTVSLDILQEQNEEAETKWIKPSQYGRGLSFHHIETADQFAQALYNKKKQDLGIVCELSSSVDQLYADAIGTQYENENKDQFPEIKYWVVLAVYTHCQESAISCDIQYGGILS